MRTTIIKAASAKKVLQGAQPQQMHKFYRNYIFQFKRISAAVTAYNFHPFSRAIIEAC